MVGGTKKQLSNKVGVTMAQTKQIDTNLKPIVVFLSSLVAMGIFVVSTLFATSVCEKWYGLVIGFILMIVAIPVHCFGKKMKISYALSFIVNSVANGFSVSAYYIDQKELLNISDMFKACVFPVVLLFVVFLLVQLFPEIKKNICISAIVIGCIMLVTFVVLEIKRDGMLFSFSFFSTLLALFSVGVMGVTANNKRYVLSDISFGSFGAFIIITIVVLFVISDGELLEAFDVSGGDSGKKPKHKKNKQ